MIVLIALLLLIAWCLVIIIQRENKHIYLRDSQGRFTAKMKRRTARRFHSVPDMRKEIGLNAYTN